MRAAIVALSLVSLLSNSCNAQPPLSVERFLGEAIAAHGGVKIDQYLAEVMLLQGKLVMAGKEVDFTGEFILQLPSQFRHTVRFELDGKKHETIAVFNGDRGWRIRDSVMEEMSRIELTQARDVLHALKLSRLSGIPNNRDCQLMSINGSMNPIVVDGRRALGVKAACKGEKDVVLWFEQDRKFLLKLERTLQVDDTHTAKLEESFGDFREVGGIIRAFKRTTMIDGKKIVESKSTEIRLYPRVDEKVFSKPQ